MGKYMIFKSVEQRLNTIRALADQMMGECQAANGKIQANVLFFGSEDPAGTTGLAVMSAPVGIMYNINVLMDRLGTPRHMHEAAADIIKDGMTLMACRSARAEMLAKDPNAVIPEDLAQTIAQLEEKYPEPAQADVEQDPKPEPAPIVLSGL